ncbi:type I-U CRISPR-associated helicase/endonuclease Cas3 [Corynebacterium sp.]|uniref:type I-G CRISPR-associated helicase/endonuclease Cas3g n=1 Tax=Corynebacterium sp. TaxID=1720 RepID=UPI0026DBA78E|nr:type I-U CRISPR-associated helicase/endonuclease Cas3 [Corynebacterium sp.]MDO5076187.1 type I-U CRISPR-associated helicase/endonuclease Cas3 [Corynebacterium sp.]
MLQIDQFDRFFAALNGGHTPFTWQCELLEKVAKTGQWPDQIVAPTGAGKSSVVDIHLFANALAAAGIGARVPRRLSVVVNRRALVDNQQSRAEGILNRMHELLEHGAKNPNDAVVLEAAQALRALRTENDGAADPFVVGHLRGALSNRTIPVNDPSSVAVIAATPDMWGSRLLFRGYGSTKRARPRETALLAIDSVLVLDEAHLNKQLLCTARRARELQTYGTDIGVPLLQVVETTATPDTNGGLISIGVNPQKLNTERDIPLQKRITAAKRLQYQAVEKWNGKPANTAVVNTIVEKLESQLQTFGKTTGNAAATIGCVVNHVDTATRVAKLLRKKELSVELLVGRMRAADVEALKQRRHGLFTPKGDPAVDVVVATQTIEVGVDIDFAAMVTELAPGSSLTQRFGRVNRLGERADSEIVIVGPQDAEEIKPSHPPYKGDDLRAAFEWVHRLLNIGNVNPATIDENPAPSASPDRLLFQRLEFVELMNYARTSDSLFAEQDLALWLRDSLTDESAAGGIVVRSPLPQNDSACCDLLSALPPRDEEVFPAALTILRDILDALVMSDNERYKAELNSPAIRRRAFLYREREITQCTEQTRLQPGDVIVIDAALPFTTEQVADRKPQDKSAPLPIADPSCEVLVFKEEDGRRNSPWFQKFAGLSPDEATELWIESGHKDEEILVPTTVQDFPGIGEIVEWYAVRTRSIDADEENREIWTHSIDAVILERHQRDVAERSKLICDKVNLQEQYANDVVFAAAHHDDGKADWRFQTMLGRDANGPELAKSQDRTRQQAAVAKHRSGLPQGWRHEQMSALLVATGKTIGEETALVSETALRIIGCSHGQGRSDFPHTLEGLLFETAEKDLLKHAKSLFVEGAWDAMIWKTDKEIGPYQMAYLESLERAADAQISKEGK